MARKLALLALLLVLGLALWIRKGSASHAPPLAAPSAQPAKEQTLESAQTESVPEDRREPVATAESARTAALVVLCRAKKTGAPIANETLFLCEESTRPARVPNGTGTHGKLGDSLATGPEGRVEFELPANMPSHLWVSDWRNGPRPAQDGSIAALGAGERRELTLELDPPPQDFCGRVVARDDRTPIAGASLTNRKLEFFTEADGRFVLPASNNVYTIAAEGFAEIRVVAQAGHETPDTQLLIELDRGGTLVGVLSNAGGLPASGELHFQVSADLSRMLLADPDESGGHHGLRGVRDWRAEFDATGRAVISGLPPRMPLKVAVLEGRTKVLVSEDIKLAAGEKREVKLDLSGTCELTGCVRDDADQPVADVQLWLMPASASAPRMFVTLDEEKCATTSMTGDDGRFRIPGVAPGSWLLGPGCVSRTYGEPLPNDAVAPFPTRIEIPAGTPALEIVLRVHVGITIRGRVLDNEDKPARAVVFAAGPSSFVSGHADSNGNFEVGPLVPGSYSLRAGFDGTYVASETVEVDAGAQDVVLRVSRGATLTGQAVDGATGAGVEAELTLSRSGDARMSMSVIHSGADGSFKFGGLEPGSYLLTASMQDGRYGMLRTLEVGPLSPIEGVRLTLTPGASLRVGYEGQQDFGQLKILRDGEPLTRDGVTRGKPTRFRVPSGSLRFVFAVGGKEQVRDLVLKPGEEQELVFKDED